MDAKHEPIQMANDSGTCHSPGRLVRFPHECEIGELCNNNSDAGSSSHEHVYHHLVTFGRLYFFPPTPLSSQVLSRLREFKGYTFLLAPWWPNQAWFPTLLGQDTSHSPLPNPSLTQVMRGNVAFMSPC